MLLLSASKWKGSRNKSQMIYVYVYLYIRTAKLGKDMLCAMLYNLFYLGMQMISLSWAFYTYNI